MKQTVAREMVGKKKRQSDGRRRKLGDIRELMLEIANPKTSLSDSFSLPSTIEQIRPSGLCRSLLSSG